MPLILDRAGTWRPPEGWVRLTTIDAHAAGEPLRVIVAGWPELGGASILQRRQKAALIHDRLRTSLMWEPRGHADMYGCLLTPAVRPDSDFGVLFLHNEGYSTMCGHGIIAVTTVVLETGMLPVTGPSTPVRIDTPAGLVTATARVDADRVRSVVFENVPSFVLAADRTVEVPGVGTVRYDLAYGGAFYAFVEAADVGLQMVRAETDRLVELGMAVKRAVTTAEEIAHPEVDDLGFLYGTIFTGPAHGRVADSRNVCIFADGEVDRSPTGTGVSARAAIHHARGELALGETMVIESLIGTSFTVCPEEVATVGRHPAVVPRVEGSAFLTGRHEFVLNPDDPLVEGFLVR